MRFARSVIPVAALSFGIVSAHPPQWDQEDHAFPQSHASYDKQAWEHSVPAASVTAASAAGALASATSAAASPAVASPAVASSAVASPAVSSSPSTTSSAASTSGAACVSAGSRSWGLANFESLVTFGDSYTDENRLAYFIANNGSAPPVGYVGPVSNMTASGGRVWPRYVADYTGVNLYDYAVSGAVCSNAIVRRVFAPINAPFPSVQEYEIPAFVADSQYVQPNGVKFMKNAAGSTVYSMWIGTNDLGGNAFLSDSQLGNATLPDYVNCVFKQLDAIYANGGRYFVVQNIAPLQLSPLYATPENGGVGPTRFWQTKGNNLTEISYRMWEQVATVNAIYQYKVPYELLIAGRYPGAHFAIMDMYSLISDIYYNPSAYLNGTAPPNVTGWDNHCNLAGTVCARSNSPDSYLWYDELHPSEQADRVIAMNFVNVVKGQSKYATYWSS